MKRSTNYQTSAVKRAAKGMLVASSESVRSTSIYGFKNKALKMSGDEMKAAWKTVSSSMSHTPKNPN